MQKLVRFVSMLSFRYHSSKDNFSGPRPSFRTKHIRSSSSRKDILYFKLVRNKTTYLGMSGNKIDLLCQFIFSAQMGTLSNVQNQFQCHMLFMDHVIYFQVI